MKVLLDNQIFEFQKFGGISRYFSKLKQHIEYIDQKDFYNPDFKIELSYFERFKRKFYSEKSESYSLLLQERKKKYYRCHFQKLEYNLFHPTYYDNYFLDHIDKPFVITVYDMIHERYPEYFETNEVSKRKKELCDKAKRIIAISQTTKDDLIEIFDIKEEKIEVIYLATDYGSIDPIQPNFTLDQKKYILFTGNRSAYKNFLTFLVAVAAILKDDPNLHLICTGPAFTKLELAWLEELEILGKVHSYFCHNDHELVYFYQNAECFVFPSLYEGFGFPVLEAFASNCPLVSSNGGSLPEIAEDGALYFDPKNTREMKEAIEKVLYNQVVRDELIESGRNRLRQFSWEKCAKETMSLYSKAI